MPFARLRSFFIYWEEGGFGVELFNLGFKNKELLKLGFPGFAWLEMNFIIIIFNNYLFIYYLLIYICFRNCLLFFAYIIIFIIKIDYCYN